MKKLFSLALCALLGINAWAYENTPATFSWTVGKEAEATVTSDATDAVKQTKYSAGTGLTVGTRSNLTANNGVTMVTFTPKENKPGNVASVVVEYSVKLKKGLTFKLTQLSYEAVKQGTDDASYSWSYTVDGEESAITTVDKTNILRDNKTSGTDGNPALLHTENFENVAGQTVTIRFYVSGFNAGKYFCLSHINLIGTISGEEEVRAFTNFKIEFRDNPYTVIEPENGELPAGVTVAGTSYNGSQHGIQGGTITVPVDGPVKFTIGACQYSNGVITVKKDGENFATVSNKAACGETAGNFEQFVDWTYNVEEAAVLTFELASQVYVPYFFAEACDFVPEVYVKYYDVDGKTLIGIDTVPGNSGLVYRYGASDVTVPEGMKFRGWFTDATKSASKVKEGFVLAQDLSLFAQVCVIEVAEVGKIFDYDFRQANFDPAEHELLTVTGGSYNGSQHGWAFSNGNTISIQVAGNALLAVGVCTYSNTAITEVKDAEGNKVGELNVEKNTTADGEEQVIRYTGDATTLTFYFTATSYIHRIEVYNVLGFVDKDETTGYYIVPAGDAASLILTLKQIKAGEKIFLPNGVYDLGEKVLTEINKNNISIIGQSMEGTVIKNAPDASTESINNTATLYIIKDITGTYLQDLTIQNDLDYYKNNNGRAVALWDKGTKTICKNVRLLSYQDTYYSNLSGAVKFFDDCEIHGTVDFICGDGSVYFRNNLLYAEKRSSNGSGSDALTANNGPATDKGYVFVDCTIKSECPVVSLGRAWNNTPSVAFINTLVDYSAGEFGFVGSGIERWTQDLMNANAWPKFGEYNTHLEDGTVLTPSSNVVTFKDKAPSTATQQIETVLSAEDAAVYTMAYTLGDWAATAENDAKQAEADTKNIDAAGIYLVETEDGCQIVKGSELVVEEGASIRKANARGGFGKPAGEDEPEAVENVESKTSRAEKIFRNGQLVVIRDGKAYNALGAQL